MMKKILVLYYSQSGQLVEIVNSFMKPLKESGDYEIHWTPLLPLKPYPFPWPLYRFFDVLPESVLMEPPEMEMFSFDPDTKYDLIVLAYTVWFLSPSLPVTGFLKSPEAHVFKDTPVITIVNCRDKWLMAQERVKERVANSGGKLIDNVAFVHQGNPFSVLVTTLRWLWFGKKAGFWKIFPPAGVSETEIGKADRFGKAIISAFKSGKLDGRQPVLSGLGAVKVDAKMIQQEKAGYRNFKIWARIIRWAGRQGEFKRAPFLILFFLYLASLIIISFPLAVFFKVCINPFLKRTLDKEIEEYEQPSGSATDRLELFC